jgi:hypothetical protein
MDIHQQQNQKKQEAARQAYLLFMAFPSLPAENRNSHLHLYLRTGLINFIHPPFFKSSTKSTCFLMSVINIWQKTKLSL